MFLSFWTVSKLLLPCSLPLNITSSEKETHTLRLEVCAVPLNISSREIETHTHFDSKCPGLTPKLAKTKVTAVPEEEFTVNKQKL
jgi:hypothetical protein